MKTAGIDLTAFLPSVAAKLAHLGNDTQAEFFNTFAKELVSVCCTRYQAEAQAVAVANEASEEFKEFCAMVSYKEED